MLTGLRTDTDAVALCSSGFLLSDGASPCDFGVESFGFGFASRPGQSSSMEQDLGYGEDLNDSSTWIMGRAL